MRRQIARIRRERAKIEAHIEAVRPDIERIAKTGSAEARRVARRWLALDDVKESRGQTLLA